MTIGDLTGYPVLFNSRSLLLAGAFYEELAPSVANDLAEDDQTADWGHVAVWVLGRKSSGTLVLRPDTRGIRALIHMPDTTYSRDLLESHRRGDVPAWSFTFRAAEDEWRLELGSSTPIRRVTRMRLVSVSAGVSHPAYPATATARGAVSPLPMRRSANDLAAAQLAVKFLGHVAESRNLRLMMVGDYTTSPPRLVECRRDEPRHSWRAPMHRNARKQKLAEVS